MHFERPMMSLATSRLFSTNRWRKGFDLFALLVFVLNTGTGEAATASNAQSPVGMNLQQVTYYSSQQPFLNILKTAGGWITHGSSTWDTNEESYLNLDANGYPITLGTSNDPNAQQFTSLGVLLLRTLPSTPNGYYPSGQYVVLYDGQGTMTYGGDAALVSRSAGQDVFDVATPSAGGIDFRITVTDPNHTGNYLRNIRVCKLENLSSLNAGQVFSPAFLGLLKNFHAIRFMDWFATNQNTLSSWSNRPLPANAFWGTTQGVPVEVAIQLANAISADAWLNIPVRADDNYVTQMATLVNNQLGSSQKVYVELSNEVWNTEFPQNAYAISQGKSMFPTAMNQWYAGWEWYGMRVAQISDIWYSVYGATAFGSGVIVVMAGQGGNPGVMTEELSTPDWKGAGNGPAAAHHIGAGAISMYFGSLPSATCISGWLAQSDGGLTAFFQSLYSQTDPSVPVGGYIGQVSTAYVRPHISTLAPYKLPLIGYEGGQSFQAFPTYSETSSLQKLLVAANRDARMGAAYTAYLNAWRSNGGTLFMHFNDSGSYSQYGEWGAIESIMQTTSPLSSAPPKWQALENFISGNACWWTGCNGSTSSSATVPMAPTGLVVK